MSKNSYEGHMIWSGLKEGTIQERFDRSKELHDTLDRPAKIVIVWTDCPEFETDLEVIKSDYILKNHFWFVERK